MKEVGSRFDAADNSEEKLSEQSRVLTKQIEAQKEKIKLLEKGLQAATEKYGDADTKTQKWQQALNEAKTSLNQMESAVDKTADGVSKYASAAEKASDSSSLLGSISSAVNFSALAAGFQTVANIVESVASSVAEVGSALIEAAATTRAENAQFEQTFAGVEDAATSAIDAVAESSGMLASRLKPVAAQIYSFAKASGATADEGLDLMSEALQAAADSAAFYDTSLEDAGETLRSFLKGNYANDAALGVSATETTRNAKAMELFGQKFSDLTEIQKQQTLLKMVTDAQKLSGAMGQASRESESWENVTGNLSEAWEKFLAEVGEPLLDAIVPALKSVADEISNMDKGELVEMMQGIADAITDLVPHIPEIIDGISQMAQFMGELADAVGSVLDFAERITGESVFERMKEQMLDAVTLGHWQELKSILEWMGFWNVDKTVESVEAMNGGVRGFDSAMQGAASTTQASASQMSEAVEGESGKIAEQFKSLSNDSRTWGSDLINGIVDGINSAKGKVVAAAKSIATSISSYLHFSRPDIGPLHEYEKWMPDMMSGLANGINANAYKVEDAIAAVANKMQVNLNGAVGRSGNITQNISFGYEVQAPDVVAAKIRQQTTYGLAAVM